MENGNNDTVNLKELFKKWCKDTKRSGGVLVGSSVREFLYHIEANCTIIKKKQNGIDKKQAEQTS